MKKAVSAFFAVIFAVCVLSVTAFAEELKAPVVQFKLVNHDEIALRWSEVRGADYYRVYRTDAATGKTVKYKTTKETEVNIKNLTAETDYIFKVAAVREKDGEIIAEVKSRGTHVTTPKEWYYSYSAASNGHYWTYKYFKENYSKTIHTDIILKDIKSVEEFAYYDGWIYFISIRGGHYVGRIREDGTGEEILFDDFGSGDGWSYNCKVYEDYIYLYRELTEYDVTYISDFHKISLKTGEVTKICDVFSSFYFDVYDDYVYFIYYPLKYNEEIKGYTNNKNGKSYLCRAKTDGTGKEKICDFSENNVNAFYKMYIYDDEIYFYSTGYSTKIYKMPLTGGDVQEISISENYLKINDFDIVNGYIYFTQYGYLERNLESSLTDTYKEIKSIAYYRLKTDGTGLTKQKKPFEWKF